MAGQQIYDDATETVEKKATETGKAAAEAASQASTKAQDCANHATERMGEKIEEFKQQA